MTAEQNEWIIKKAVFRNMIDCIPNKGGTIYHIPESIIDQIRREAVEEYNKKGSWELIAQDVEQIKLEVKKELLDEIDNIIGHSGDISWAIGLDPIDIGKHNCLLMRRIRAKTLGEKK